jgi:hypothetical protein
MQISGVTIQGGVNLIPPPAGPVNYDGNLNFGSSTVLDSSVNGSAGRFSSAWDSVNSKIILAYQNYDGSSSPTATDGYISIGTVSGNSVSYGSAVKFSDQATYGQVESEGVAVCYDSNAQKGVVVWAGGSGSGISASVYARTITVSGTTCTLGSVTTLVVCQAKYVRAIYDSANNKIVVMFQNDFRVGTSDDKHGYSFVGTVSGTNISFGSLVKFTSNKVYDLSTCYDSTNGKIVVAYWDHTDYNGKVQVGTVSGTSISWGSANTGTGFAPQITTGTSMAYDSDEQRIVISYSHRNNSGYGTSIVGEISGSSITFGTAVTFNSANSQFSSSTYDPISKKIVMNFKGTNSIGKCVVGTVSGSSISFLPLVNLNGSETEIGQYSSILAIGGKASVHVAFRNTNNSAKSTGVVATIT